MAYPKHITASTLLDQSKSCLKSEKTKDKTGQNRRQTKTKNQTKQIWSKIVREMPDRGDIRDSFYNQLVFQLGIQYEQYSQALWWVFCGPVLFIFLHFCANFCL